MPTTHFTNLISRLTKGFNHTQGAVTAATEAQALQIHAQTFQTARNSCGTTAVTIASNASTVWYNWTGSTYETPALSATQSEAWIQWQEAVTFYNGRAYLNTTSGPALYQPDADAAHAAIREAGRIAAAARDVATKRAQALLNACLNEEQRRMLAAVNYFEVKSSRGTIYRVYRGQAGNIVRLEAGREIERLCIHPRQHSVPNEDAMLIQKLMIETEEERLLSIANKSRIAA